MIGTNIVTAFLIDQKRIRRKDMRIKVHQTFITKALHSCSKYLPPTN